LEQSANPLGAQVTPPLNYKTKNKKVRIHAGLGAIFIRRVLVRKKRGKMSRSKKPLSVKIDYVTIVFEQAKAWDVIRDLLKFRGMEWLFHEASGRIAHKGYTTLYSSGMINVYGNCPKTLANPNGSGAYLQLSGTGCRDLEIILQAQKRGWEDLFEDCIRLFGKDGFHLTRLDVAIDDRNEIPYFTIPQIRRKCERDEFVSRSKYFRFDESRCREGATGKTEYIGDEKSNIRYRFYDKDKEQVEKRNRTLSEVGSWKRTEIQLRDQVSHAFALELIKRERTLGRMTADFLGANLRFVVPDTEQSNRSRLKTCRFWERFLGDISPLKLEFHEESNTLYETFKWVVEGGGLSAVDLFELLEENQALGNLESLKKYRQETRYSESMARKAVTHLREQGREELIPRIYERTKK